MQSLFCQSLGTQSLFSKDRMWMISEKQVDLLMASTVRVHLEVGALQALGGCGALRSVVQEHVIQEASALFAKEWELVAHVIISVTSV